MASIKIGFATITPNSGSGAATLSISGDNFTGRVRRSVDLNIVNDKDRNKKTIIIEQNPKEEFVSMDNYSIIQKEGGTVTIHGKSNSDILTFRYNQDPSHPIVTKIPATYTANGSPTRNSANISGDPGAQAEYDFSITLSDIANNSGIYELKGVLTVTDNKGHQTSCELLQVSSKGTFVIHPTNIDLDVTGEKKMFHVLSATEWQITNIE